MSPTDLMRDRYVGLTEARCAGPEALAEHLEQNRDVDLKSIPMGDLRAALAHVTNPVLRADIRVLLADCPPS